MAAESLRTPAAWVLPLVAAVAALGLWVADGDVRVFQLINDAARALPDETLLALTLLGNALAALALLATVTACRASLVWAALLASIPGTLFVRGLKPLLGIPRPAAVLEPVGLHVVGPVYKALSFPSGHTATAFAVAAVAYCLGGDRRLRAMALLVAAAVAFSRVAVGAHWPTDVLAGAAGGWLSGYLGVLAARHIAWTGSPAAREGARWVVVAAGAMLLLWEYDLWLEAAAGRTLGALAVAVGLVTLYRLRQAGAQVAGGDPARRSPWPWLERLSRR